MNHGVSRVCYPPIGGMELRRSRVWNQPEGLYVIKPQEDAKCTLARDAMRLWRLHAMRKRIDYMPSLRLG